MWLAGGHLGLGRGRCLDFGIEAGEMSAAAAAVVVVPATAGGGEGHQAGADQQGRNSPFRGHEKYLLVPGEFARERDDRPTDCIGRASTVFRGISPPETPRLCAGVLKRGLLRSIMGTSAAVARMEYHVPRKRTLNSWRSHG